MSIGGNTGHVHCFPHLTAAHFRSSKAEAPVASWPRPILPGEPLLQLRPSHHGRRLHASHTQDDQRFQKVLQDGLAWTSTCLVMSGPPGEADRPQGWGAGVAVSTAVQEPVRWLAGGRWQRLPGSDQACGVQPPSV